MRFTKRAEKRFLKLPLKIKKSFKEDLLFLDEKGSEGSSVDVKILQFKQSKLKKYFRVRQGSYRLIYIHESNELIVLLAGKREDVYEEFKRLIQK